MNLFSEDCCPTCHSENIHPHTSYLTNNGEQRYIYHCQDCQDYFSETKATPLAGLRTPLSTIRQVMDALNDGMGINAAVRTFKVAKNTIYNWLERLADLKEVLLLYALCHQFLRQLVEGDELYTKVKENKAPDQSAGWTIVLMDRASRFIWDMKCGQRTRSLFQAAMETLQQVIEQTQDLTLVTDGERRYGNLLFEICRQALRTGQVGRPRQTLPKGVKVRLKNKGSQAHHRGPKRPKYQAPQPEHPETVQDVAEEDIHANHLEGFNAGMRRKLACYRRRTNTYAKQEETLQRRLDVHWVLHNFVRPHFTTRLVPAVALGILESGLSLVELFKVRYI
jgi:transposase-like protein/IS1 family transposase